MFSIDILLACYSRYCTVHDAKVGTTVQYWHIPCPLCRDSSVDHVRKTIEYNAQVSDASLPGVTGTVESCS
jgi:hypothetical protein